MSDPAVEAANRSMAKNHETVDSGLKPYLPVVNDAAREAITQGVPVTGPPQPGDLVFPAAELGSGGPRHVVLAISATEAIEAPGRGMSVRTIPMPVIGAARRIV